MKKVAERMWKEDGIVLVQGLCTGFSRNKCDNCYILRDNIHRCGACLTKAYCSRECQNVDWAVHKLYCKELVGDRGRVKGGKEARTEVGRGVYRDLTNKLLADPTMGLLQQSVARLTQIFGNLNEV